MAAENERELIELVKAQAAAMQALSIELATSRILLASVIATLSASGQIDPAICEHIGLICAADLPGDASALVSARLVEAFAPLLVTERQANAGEVVH